MKRKPKSKFDFMTFAGTVGGAIVGRVVAAKLPIQNNLIKNLVPVGVGAFLMNQRSPIIAAAGTGMIAAGGSGLVAAIVPGIAGVAMSDVINGDDDFNIMGVGAEDTPILIEGVGQGVDVGFNQRIASATDVLNGGDEFIAGGTDEFMA